MTTIHFKFYGFEKYFNPIQTFIQRQPPTTITVHHESAIGMHGGIWDVLYQVNLSLEDACVLFRKLETYIHAQRSGIEKEDNPCFQLELVQILAGGYYGPPTI